jgi:hypothetical protein
MEMELLLFWLFFCVLVGLFASERRNRSGIGWFLVAFIFSPILAFLIVAVLKEHDGVSSVGPSWLLGNHESRPWSAGTPRQQRQLNHWDRLKAKSDW